ncbi:ribbon-helix-helix protein, CopG family [Halalkalicoccus subterraneus]|uniref:ribbon-helix-helix protein, CopG family n=1 Tax=Halalkalicoccus subterraneus TaxID=2675002 RepID=UPI000EFD1D02|nr:ribbon-helix-helix protein, CopG family [Halalkalicoccus subterraneus]
MQRVSVKLDEDMVEQLDSLADDQSVTRSDIIRDTLDDGLNTDDDVEIQRLQERIADLETENKRLRREKRLVLEQREEHTELVNAVKEEQSLAKRKAEAGLWTKTKWALFGITLPVDRVTYNRKRENMS